MKQNQFEKSTRTCSLYSTTTVSTSRSTSTADYDIEYSHDDEQDDNIESQQRRDNNPLDSPPINSRCYYCQKNQILSSCPYHSISNSNNHHQPQQPQPQRHNIFLQISSSQLSPVYSEAMSYSLTPVDESRYFGHHYSSISSTFSPLLRKVRSYSDEVTSIKTKKSNSCLDNTIILDKLSIEKELEVNTKNDMIHENYGEGESLNIEEIKEKRRIFQLKQNKIYPPQILSQLPINNNIGHQSYDETKSKSYTSLFSNLNSIRNFFSTKKRRSSEPPAHFFFHNRIHIETT